MAQATLADQMWETAAEQITPTSSLQKIETQAKYLFTSVTVVGSLLTGLGLLNGVPVTQGSWLLLPVGLVGTSLALAMYALTPRLKAVDVDNIYSVKAFYESSIVRGGVALFVAGLLFALALLSAVFVFPLLRAKTDKSVITASPTLKVTQEKTGQSFSCKVALSGLPSGAQAEVQVAGKMPKTETWVPLLTQVSTTSSEGKLDASSEVSSATLYQQFKMTVRVRDKGGRLLHSEEMLAPL
jgi:hypothetical protein